MADSHSPTVCVLCCNLAVVCSRAVSSVLTNFGSHVIVSLVVQSSDGINHWSVKLYLGLWHSTKHLPLPIQNPARTPQKAPFEKKRANNMRGNEDFLTLCTHSNPKMSKHMQISEVMHITHFQDVDAIDLILMKIVVNYLDNQDQISTGNFQPNTEDESFKSLDNPMKKIHQIWPNVPCEGYISVFVHPVLLHNSLVNGSREMIMHNAEPGLNEIMREGEKC
ncbi:hypothetical protein EI94DRAFT_1698494 [Lactarius quietus]|nr:hypothetical protein EI94DRAFT_1698494 [Lactarius quietus]